MAEVLPYYSLQTTTRRVPRAFFISGLIFGAASCIGQCISVSIGWTGSLNFYVVQSLANLAGAVIILIACAAVLRGRQTLRFARLASSAAILVFVGSLAITVWRHLPFPSGNAWQGAIVLVTVAMEYLLYALFIPLFWLILLLDREDPMRLSPARLAAAALIAVPVISLAIDLVSFASLGRDLFKGIQSVMRDPQFIVGVAGMVLTIAALVLCLMSVRASCRDHAGTYIWLAIAFILLARLGRSAAMMLHPFPGSHNHVSIILVTGAIAGAIVIICPMLPAIILTRVSGGIDDLDDSIPAAELEYDH